MKKSIFLLIAITAFITNAFSQSGSIKGQILNNQDHIANNVVILLNNKISQQVDSLGHFKFDNLEPAIYTLKVNHISYKSQSITIELKANEHRVINFKLDEVRNQLVEVHINAAQNIVDQEPSNSLRVQTPLLELAQNVQTINSSILGKQQIFNLADGPFRNVSGVSRKSHWNDLYVNINMRGSKIQAFRNGINIVNSNWGPLSEDMATVERIEFVKGPAGFMMSSGDPAGIYNVVTKKPTGNNNITANFSLGNFETFRSSVDLDGTIKKDKSLLYRLNIANTSSGSFRPFEKNKRLVIAPVLSYQFNKKTTATLEYTFQKANMTDVGSAYLMSPKGYKSLEREATFSAPGLEPLDIEEYNVYLNIDHKLSENWKVTAQGSYFNFDQTGANSWPSQIFDDGKIIRSSSIWDAKSEMSMGQIYVNGNFQSASVKHRLLVGLDLGSKNYMADWSAERLLDTLNGGEFDPKKPDFGLDIKYVNFDRTTPLSVRALEGGGISSSNYTSLYFQDELGLFKKKLRVTLAARLTSMTLQSSINNKITSRKITPRIGLSYSIDNHSAIYALYDQAFLPQNGVLFNKAEVKPITGENYEIGLKREWFNGKWISSLAVYQILKNNEVTSYGINPNELTEIGQKKVQGIEFDIKGSLTKELRIIANYAYTDGKISKVNPEANPPGKELFYVGQRLTGSDKHIANLWLDYEFCHGKLNGLGLQLAANCNFDRASVFYTSTNKNENIEDYYRYDAGLSYRHEKFSLLFQIQNLANSYQIEGGNYNTTYFKTPVYIWQSSSPRNFKLTLSYSL